VINGKCIYRCVQAQCQINGRNLLVAIHNHSKWPLYQFSCSLVHSQVILWKARRILSTHLQSWLVCNWNATRGKC